VPVTETFDGGGLIMSVTLSEGDWKLFRRYQPVALERFCQRVLDDVCRLAADPGRAAHDRYLAVYALVRDRDRELAAALDGPSRSTAFGQLARLRAEGLLADDEFAGFSADARSAIDAPIAAGRGSPT
jgi:hypothetical protein